MYVNLHQVFIIEVLDKWLMLSIVSFNDVLKSFDIIDDYFPIVHSGFKLLPNLHFLVNVFFVN